VLLDVPLPLTLLRVKSTESKLTAGGGCGEGTIGWAREPAAKLVAKPGTRVYFTSHVQAGRYVGMPRPVADPGATGLVCIAVDYVEGGLCFDAVDLVETMVR